MINEIPKQGKRHKSKRETVNTIGSETASFSTPRYTPNTKRKKLENIITNLMDDFKGEDTQNQTSKTIDL